MKSLKLLPFIIAAAMSFNANIAHARLSCPSVAQVKSVSIVEARATCDNPRGCRTFAGVGYIHHNGKLWVVGTGVFSSKNVLNEGQSLLKKAGKPSVIKRQGIEGCAYYYSYWQNKYVGAVLEEDMEIYPSMDFFLHQ